MEQPNRGSREGDGRRVGGGGNHRGYPQLSQDTRMNNGASGGSSIGTTLTPSSSRYHHANTGHAAGGGGTRQRYNSAGVK